jgi:hypothetical protein
MDLVMLRVCVCEASQRRQSDDVSVDKVTILVCEK